MTTNALNYNPNLTKYIVESELLSKEEAFFLIDVGASGGIDSCWNAFGKYLHGVGFEPLVEECNRLNALNQNPQLAIFPSYAE